MQLTIKSKCQIAELYTAKLWPSIHPKNSKLAQNCTKMFKKQCLLLWKQPFNHIKRYWSRKKGFRTFMKNWRILFLAQDIVQFLLYYLYLMETFFKPLSHTLSKKYFETEREKAVIKGFAAV